MDKNKKNSAFDDCYKFSTIFYCFFIIPTVCFFAAFYESKSIPGYILNVIQHNLESTPIIDIISGEQCEIDDTSNILGYYYGFDSGFKYDKQSYREDYREEICTYWSRNCIKVNAQRPIPYNYFKNQRLCTSKRPDKNYFDYIDSSYMIFMKNAPKVPKNVEDWINREVYVLKLQKNAQLMI